LSGWRLRCAESLLRGVVWLLSQLQVHLAMGMSFFLHHSHRSLLLNSQDRLVQLEVSGSLLQLQVNPVSWREATPWEVSTGLFQVLSVDWAASFFMVVVVQFFFSSVV